ncbi:hypothetical protein [Polaribacter sp. KT 15]|uniref:hypothetical protein n=1 Tax=Polaribacter sp. KT 15 TaxID=1896175 RepID=UPI00090C5538|nr:hypothetical protein [Polaribacter sp. KT 15]SHM93362.1 hypothetical protein SAMN05720268_1489 [Polaribacter sp. KT 15]
MKLTQNHIQELYKFTRKHYVEYYDVQSELVDHLANDIEEIWIENPNLSFEDARDKSFKKFGVFGFMNVVEQKQTQMTKRYFKIILKFIKEWFRLPKIVLTALLFLGFYQLQKLPNAYNIYIAVFIVVILLECYTIIKNSRKLKKKTNKTGKKWMFENIIAINGIGNSALILLYAFDFLFPDNAKDFLLMGDFRKALSAAIITLLILFGYVSLIVIPKKAEELLQETYPEYKFS